MASDRIRHLFKLDQGLTITQHQPDEHMIFNVRRPRIIAHAQSNVAEQKRALVLEYCREIIDGTTRGDKSHFYTLFQLTKVIAYWLIFDVLGGETVDNSLVLLASVATHLAMRADQLSIAHKTIADFYAPPQPSNDQFIQTIQRQFTSDFPAFFAQRSQGRFTTNQFLEVITELDTTYRRDMEQFLSSLDVQILGQGSYGVVFKNPLPNKANNGSEIVYDKNVTKLYKKKENMNKAIKNAKLAEELFNNQSYQVFPHSNRKMKNLPSKLQLALTHQNLYKPNANVYALRMMNLGDSIHSIIESDSKKRAFRTCSFYKVMGQLYKCHSQLVTLAKRQYIHADIRPPNMMWRQETCELFFIDFDLLNSYDGFDVTYRKHFGHVSNPPETTMVSSNPDMRNARLHHWIESNRNTYGLVFASIYGSQAAYIDAATDAIKESKSYITQRAMEMTRFGGNRSDENANRYKVIREMTYPSFDSYSYAQVISLFFAVMYVNAMWLMFPEQGVDDLKTRLKDGDTEYEPEYLRLIVDTLQSLGVMFGEMSDFNMRVRKNAVDSFEDMKRIYIQFAREHNRLRPHAPIDTKEEIAAVIEDAKEEVNAGIAAAEELTDEDHAIIYAQHMFNETPAVKGGYQTRKQRAQRKHTMKRRRTVAQKKEKIEAGRTKKKKLPQPIITYQK